MMPSTGMQYSDEVSFELARSWSAAAQRSDSSCSMFWSWVMRQSDRMAAFLKSARVRRLSTKGLRLSRSLGQTDDCRDMRYRWRLTRGDGIAHWANGTCSIKS